MKTKRKGKRKKSFLLILFIFILSIIGGYVIAEKKKNRERMLKAIKEVQLPPGEKLTETRPILSPAIFRGNVFSAYLMAAEIPWIIDKQFCYCYCKKKLGHKTLLTCFTSNHGAKCDLCMNEVFTAYKLYKKGFATGEIVAAIDREFSRYKEDQH